jgi:uncharacterized Ntn-hydrolase superfamily protein
VVRYFVRNNTPMVRTTAAFLLLVIISLRSPAQIFCGDPLANTFSIIARDSVTGDMGAAVQSHWFSAGRSVIWAEAGVGVVATQSFANLAFGQKGLELLKEGRSAQDVVTMLIASDDPDQRDGRQLAVMDNQGRTANWTGKNCIPEAGHISGNNFSAQANLMINNKVWPAMAKAFRNTKGPLAERLVSALEAAQSAGGDIRGKQSSGLLVVRAKATGTLWEDVYIDLRVDDHKEPILELKRLLKVFRAIEHMGSGNDAVQNNDLPTAMREYAEADRLSPEKEEIKFWSAVTLVNKGYMKEGLPIFKEVIGHDQKWLILAKRLVQVGLLTADEATLNRIYAFQDKIK